MNVVTPDGELVYRLESPKPPKPWCTPFQAWAGIVIAILTAVATLV